MLNKVFRNALIFVVLILFITSIIMPVTFSQNSLSDRLNISKLNLGNTLYVGGSGPSNYTTIQSAIDNALSGDIVFVYKGIYYENILINKVINLIGEDKDNTIIDGSGSGNVIYSICQDVTIKEFTVQNGSNSAGHSNNCCIEVNSRNNTICHTNIKNSYRGIHLYASENSVITNVTLSNGILDGLYIEYSHYTTIKNNTIQSYSNGIYLEASKNNIITNNNVFNNEIGIYLHGLSNDNILLENNIFQNSNLGLYVYASNDNEFYHNNFIDNTNHVKGYHSINSWDNGYPSGGNYWDDYTGLDNFYGPNQDIPSSDGIGDTPYLINGDAHQDNYPLMNPLNIDADGDGYYAYPYGDDCDDTDPNVNPGTSEICYNGIDDDCDGLTDSEDPDCDNGNIPYIRLLNPVEKDIIKDTITIKWNAHDSEDGTNIPIYFYLYDENDIFTIFEDNPYDNTGDLQWDTTQYPDGEYRLLIETQDSYLNIGLDDALITIKNHEDPIENLPPNKPFKPSGESSGKTGDEYSYQTSTSDPEGDQIWYKWDWGDDTSGWIGPYDGGVTITTPHTWEEDGEYSIKVKAKDEHGNESPWSDPLTVNMPKTWIFNQIPRIIIWLFERFPFLQSYFSHFF